MSAAAALPDAALAARRRYFPAVEGMRAFAALSVLIGHVLYFGHPGGGALRTLGFWMASFGVVVFFAISGFLLYRPFVAARRTRESVGSIAPSYLWRRAVRIFPAYWVALTVLAIWLSLSGVFSSQWWAYYGLLEIYSPSWGAGGLPVAWSLGVEVSFYLALPLIAALLATRGAGSGNRSAWRWELGLLAGLATLSLVWYSIYSPDPGSAWLSFNLLALFTWFSGGMLLAALQVARPPGHSRLWPLARPEVCWPLAAGVFALLPLGAFSGLSPHLEAAMISISLFLAAGLLVAPSMMGDSGRVVGLALESRVAVFLGTISYGIYLWHYPIVNHLYGTGLVRESPSPVLSAAILALGASIALGTASWYLIEKPLMRRARSVKAFEHVDRETVEPPPVPRSLAFPARGPVARDEAR